MAAYFVVNDTKLFSGPGNYTTSRDATCGMTGWPQRTLSAA